MTQATIISCQQRTETREETARQLRAVGLEPHIVLSPCDPLANRATHLAPGSRGNATATAKALQRCLDLEADCLFCEDDITLASDFPAFLGMARSSGAVTWLFMLERPEKMAAHYPPALIKRIESGHPMPRALIEPLRVGDIRGSQCVYLPHAFLVRTIHDRLPYAGVPSDWFIASEAARLKWPARVAMPNPVQHRHVRVARSADRLDKASRSYHLPRLEGHAQDAHEGHSLNAVHGQH